MIYLLKLGGDFMSNPVLADSNKRLTRIPVTVSASCTRKTENFHFHDYTHIWYVLAGQLHHTVENELYIQNSGDCVIVPPFTTHKIDLSISEETPVVVDISFRDSFLLDRGYRFFSIQRRFEECKIPIFKRIDNENKENADSLMRALLTEFSKKHDMSFDSIASLVVSFLKMICVEHANDGNFYLLRERIELVMDTVNYISHNFNKKLSIDELCSVSTMSRRMLTDNFKAVTGMTVIQFVNSLRIVKASTLLMHTEKSISEIATECGFYDKSHLIHAYAEYSGTTPAKYREKIKPLVPSGEKAFESKWGWLFEEKSQQK